MNEIFFSVCICAKKREKTIFNTLKSLCLQNYKNFETILFIDNDSRQASIEIDRFLESNIYIINKINIKIERVNKYFKGVEEWNEPIKSASGKYIAMLEGDDKFEPMHLQRAYEYLSQNKDVGIYCTGNQNHKRGIVGKINSKDYFNQIYSMKEVPPPSETIFVRMDSKTSNKFLYNDKAFVYAPEIDLYLRITKCGYNAYHDDKNDVTRDVSHKNRDSWKYVQDHFYIMNKYKNNVSKISFNKVKKMLVKESIEKYYLSKKLGNKNYVEIEKNLLNIVSKKQFANLKIKYNINLIRNKIMFEKKWSRIAKNLTAKNKFWRRKNYKIAIYGIGGHTDILLNYISIAKFNITCFLDSNKKGINYYEKNVYSYDDIVDLNLDVIIISSESFEIEIFENLNKLNLEKCSIIKLYD